MLANPYNTSMIVSPGIAKSKIGEILEPISSGFNNNIIGFNENKEEVVTQQVGNIKVDTSAEVHSSNAMVSINQGSKTGISIGTPDALTFIGGLKLNADSNSRTNSFGVGGSLKLLGLSIGIGLSVGKEGINIDAEVGWNNVFTGNEYKAGMYMNQNNLGGYVKSINNREFGSVTQKYSTDLVDTWKVLITLTVIAIAVIYLPVVLGSLSGVLGLITGILSQNPAIKTFGIEKNRECDNI